MSKNIRVTQDGSGNVIIQDNQFVIAMVDSLETGDRIRDCLVACEGIANPSVVPDLLAELIKQVDWLEHIRPRVKADESIMLGFEQAIKYMKAALARAKGEI